MQRRGLEVSALRNRPTLQPEYSWLYEAYLALSRSRQVGGMGGYYIPLTEFQAYCEMFCIEDTGQIHMLLNVVGAVDAILLHEQYQQAKNAS